MKRKINFQYVYQILTFLLIFSFPFLSKLSVLDLGVFQLYFFRLILIVCFFVLLFDKKIKIPFSGNMKILSGLLLYMLLYASISLLWVSDLISAIAHISFIMWGILIVLVFYSLLKTLKNGLYIIYSGWITAFIALAFFAFFEIFAIAHFDSGFVHQLEEFYDSFRKLFRAPFTTFSNPNDYATYVTISIAFFVLFLKKENSLRYLILFLCSTLLIFFSRSNLAVFSMRMILILFFMYIIYHIAIIRKPPFVQKTLFPENKNSYKIRPLFVAAIITISIIYSIFSNKTVIYNVNNYGKTEFTELPKNKQGLLMIRERFEKCREIQTDEIRPNAFESKSFEIRKNLYMNGVCIAMNTYFMGAGAGQFIEMHNKGEKTCIELEVNTDPHSFFIEILSLYGIIPLAMMVWLLISVFLVAFRTLLSQHKSGISREVLFLFSIIVVYLFMANSPSSFISMPLNWITITVMVYVSDSLMKKMRSGNPLNND